MRSNPFFVRYSDSKSATFSLLRSENGKCVFTGLL